MKTIPDDLLADLIRYHLLGLRDPDMEKRIVSGLEEKAEAMKKRQEYTKKVQSGKQ